MVGRRLDDWVKMALRNEVGCWSGSQNLAIVRDVALRNEVGVVAFRVAKFARSPRIWFSLGFGTAAFAGSGGFWAELCLAGVEAGL